MPTVYSMVSVCIEMCMSEGWGISAVETTWEFCSAWRRFQGDLPAPEGAPGELERDFGPGHGATGQGGVAFNWQRAGLDGLLGRSFLLWGWWGLGTGCPEKLILVPVWRPEGHHPQDLELLTRAGASGLCSGSRSCSSGYRCEMCDWYNRLGSWLTDQQTTNKQKRKFVN